MRRLLHIALLLLACAAPVCARQAGDMEKLRQLYDQKRYFELRDAVENYRGRPEAALPFFRGVVANAFNRQPDSARYLRQYIARAGAGGELLSDAYTLLADDFAKTHDYGRAADTYRTVIGRFGRTFNPEQLKGYENAAALYDSLRGVPRQRVVLCRAARLNGPGDGAGWSVPVEANGRRVTLGLDTGANFSLLVRSVAERLGVRMLDRPVTFGSITSIEVRTGLGFLPSMKVGGVTVHNAVFIVLDDEAMTFADGSKVEGVIGFPVIEGLGRVAFGADGTVTASPSPTRRGGRPNVCLNGRYILFRGAYEGRELTFTLDTGAERSVLYLPFLRDFEREVKAKYELRDEKFSGVGGTEEVPAYIVKDFPVSFSGKGVRLPEVRLLTRALTDNGRRFYGNVGQDLIKRFRVMSLDLASMRITFE